MKKKAYRSVLVKSVEVSDVLSRLQEGALWVGMDVGKAAVLVVLRDSAGRFERPWKVKLPSEIRELVSRLQTLKLDREVTVALESTGTYGEALRQALSDGGLAVRRVRSQATSDYAEIFDGVPSQHDGKDAAMLAELGAIGKSVAWPARAISEESARLKAEVQWLTAQQAIWQTWLGRLEGLVAKFWPEATSVLSLQSATLLRVLREYGGPRGLAADAQAAAKLAKGGRRGLTSQKLVAFLSSAGTTLGVRMTVAEEQYVKQCAVAAFDAGRAIQQARSELEKLSRGHKVIERMSESVGRCTACVLFVALGDPHDYHCGAAYRKAMGLNLKERSSGKHQGQLKITKRGPSLVRRWLFFSALRLVQRGPVRRWFEAKKAKDKDRGLGGVVAVMRKLALAVHATVTNDEAFQLERLLPGKCLKTKAPNRGQSPNEIASPNETASLNETASSTKTKSSKKSATPRNTDRSRSVAAQPAAPELESAFSEASQGQPMISAKRTRSNTRKTSSTSAIAGHPIPT